MPTAQKDDSILDKPEYNVPVQPGHSNNLTLQYTSDTDKTLYPAYWSQYSISKRDMAEVLPKAYQALQTTPYLFLLH